MQDLKAQLLAFNCRIKVVVVVGGPYYPWVCVCGCILGETGGKAKECGGVLCAAASYYLCNQLSLTTFCVSFFSNTAVTKCSLLPKATQTKGAPGQRWLYLRCTEKNQIQVTPVQGAWGILCWRLTCETQGFPPYSPPVWWVRDPLVMSQPSVTIAQRPSHNPSSVVEVVVWY